MRKASPSVISSSGTRSDAIGSRDARESAGEHEKFSLGQLWTSSSMRPKQRLWHRMPILGYGQDFAENIETLQAAEKRVN
jgi:hypothetical protein